MATIADRTLPDNLYYDRDSHLWLRYDGSLVTLGLDALGQESMGDMAYIAFEPVGRTVRRGDVLGSLEAAKMVAPILAPVRGTVVKTNDAVTRNPRLANLQPYTEGWLLTMAPMDWETESRQLVSGRAAVQSFLEDEVRRYREQGWIP